MATELGDDILRRRIRARKQGDELFALIADEFTAYSKGEQQLMAAQIAKRLGPWLPATPARSHPAQQPLSVEAARSWGQSTILPWGKHKGKAVDSVPLEYLIWLADGEDEFLGTLRRYLRSERIQREMDT